MSDGSSLNDAPPRRTLRLASWFTPRRLRIVPVDTLREVRRITLLSEDRLPELARFSTELLVASGAAFAILDILVRIVRPVPPLFGDNSFLVGVVLLVLANIVAYIVVLGVHEAVHAATILALGGRPRFGLKLPFALYCTAPGQLFTRAGYWAVALAPLLVITVIGVVVTWLEPNLSAYLWLAWVGNVSGAVGDLVTSSELRQAPANSLIADTEDGFIEYSREV